MQDSPSKQQTKQNYKPNHQQTGLPPHSDFPIRGKTKKQANKQKPQHKSHPIWSLNKPLGQLRDARNQKKEWIQPWNLGKGDFKHNKLERKMMKRHRNTTQMKERWET